MYTTMYVLKHMYLFTHFPIITSTTLPTTVSLQVYVFWVYSVCVCVCVCVWDMINVCVTWVMSMCLFWTALLYGKEQWYCMACIFSSSRQEQAYSVGCDNGTYAVLLDYADCFIGNKGKYSFTAMSARNDKLSSISVTHSGLYGDVTSYFHLKNHDYMWDSCHLPAFSTMHHL